MPFMRSLVDSMQISKLIHKPEDRSIDTSQTEGQRKKKYINTQNSKPENCENVKRCNIPNWAFR